MDITMNNNNAFSQWNLQFWPRKLLFSRRFLPRRDLGSKRFCATFSQLLLRIFRENKKILHWRALSVLVWIAYCSDLSPLSWKIIAQERPIFLKKWTFGGQIDLQIRFSWKQRIIVCRWSSNVPNAPPKVVYFELHLDYVKIAFKSIFS